MIKQPFFALAAAGLLASFSPATAEIKKTTETTTKPLTLGKKLDASVLPQKAEHWLRGEPIKTFENKQVYVIDFWMSPRVEVRPRKFYNRAPGFHHKQLRKKYAKQKQINFITVCVNSSTDKKRLNYFLSLPEFASTHPIALDGFTNKVLKDWMHASKISEIPYSLVIHDGILIWHGESNRLSYRVLKEVSQPDFNYNNFKKKNESRKANYKNFYAFQDRIGKWHQESKSADFLHKELSEKLKIYKDLDFAVMMIHEMQYYLYAQSGENTKALAVLNTMIAKFNHDAFALERVNKNLMSSASFGKEATPLKIKCLKKLASLKEAPYARRCWELIGKLKEEENDVQGALEAYENALKFTQAHQRLEMIKQGKTPALIQEL